MVRGPTLNGKFHRVGSWRALSHRELFVGRSMMNVVVPTPFYWGVIRRATKPGHFNGMKRGHHVDDLATLQDATGVIRCRDGFG